MEDNLKKTLRGLSLELRHILEGHYDPNGQWVAGDLEHRLNEVGVWRERSPRPLDELPHLSAEDKKARKAVDAYIKLREEAGVSLSDAVAEFVRESAYTWANRLFALRCMEARGIIDEVILQKEAYSGRSMVHNRFARRNPEACAGEDDGLFTVLIDEFSARASELQAVFDPDTPATALRPSIAVLKRCIALLSGRESARGQSAATDGVFEASDAFGWAYQYWQEEEKKRVDSLLKSVKGYKCEGAEIIPKTALYTDPYMVKFLVQNSLGALWMRMHSGSRLVDEWEYYVRDADTKPIARKPVADITFLDPAVGSGHFLLEAFDVLFAMYEEEGSLTTPEEIAVSILNRNLYGIDIDERATQIAVATLWMRAKERAPSLGATSDKRTNVEGDTGILERFQRHVTPTNIHLPRGRDHLAAFIKRHPEDRFLESSLRIVFESLENANELGSLLQIEEPVERELRRLKAEHDARAVESLAAHPVLFDKAKQPHLELVPFGADDWVTWKEQTIARLRHHFDEEAEAAELTSAFFGQTVSKGLDVFDLLSRRYDVVVANPPFMGQIQMGATTRAYLNEFYRGGQHDLLAAFFLLGKRLLSDTGLFACVGLHNWMFLSGYSSLRHDLFSALRIRTIAHLGTGTMKDLSNPNAQGFSLQVLENGKVDDEFEQAKGYYIRVSDDREKNAALLRKIRSNEYYIRSLKDFESIPGQPLCYWAPTSILSFLSSERRLETIVSAKAGLATGDNPRWTRFWWEVRTKDTDARSEWISCMTGGDSRSFYTPPMLAVRWGKDGLLLRQFRDVNGKLRSRPQNTRYYLTEGLTFSKISSKRPYVKFLPRGHVFLDTSRFLDSIPERRGWSLIYLNSRIVAYLLQILAPTVSITSGDIERLPCPEFESANKSDFLEDMAERIVHCRITIESCAVDSKDMSGVFSTATTCQSIMERYKHFADFVDGVCATMHAAEAIAERSLYETLDIEPSALQAVYKRCGSTVGTFPILADYDLVRSSATITDELAQEVSNQLESHTRAFLSAVELADLNARLRELYESKTVTSVSDHEPEDVEVPVSEEGSEEIFLPVDSRIQIPPETFIEELSQKLEVHPISVYWLVKNGRENEGWRSQAQEKRFTEDFFAVLVLRLIGQRWPKEGEAEGRISHDPDSDGIFLIKENVGKPSLWERLRNQISIEFLEGKVLEIEREFKTLVGVDLNDWLSRIFFKRHIAQFKKRPIAWQIESEMLKKSRTKGRKSSPTSNLEPAFSCLVYYHKLDSDLLPKMRTLHVGELQRRYETELRTLEGVEGPTINQSTRKIQLEIWIEELKTFDSRLDAVAQSGFGPDKLRPKLRQYAIDDAMLSLTSCWLKRLSQTVQDGPLQSWQEAARKTFLHGDFPGWIHDSVRNLEYSCAVVGPKAPDQKDLSVDPSSADLAPVISNQSKQMVEGALAISCDLWWKEFDDAVLAPIRQEVKQLEGEAKLLEDELETDEPQLTVLRRKEITNLRKELKTEIAGLKNELRERSRKAGNLRERIENWRCPECDTWEEWLASQPLYDEVSSLDGKRPSPRTVAEFITQESLYAPDLNDGVRVNIAPLQRAGLLAAVVLAPADLEKAIADRAEWRADERRWCREGKLPKPGWWNEGREKEAIAAHLDQI